MSGASGACNIVAFKETARDELPNISCNGIIINSLVAIPVSTVVLRLLIVRSCGTVAEHIIKLLI